nr:MAG TPA: hypothetical protein [Caudoviricetes sp.]
MKASSKKGRMTCNNKYKCTLWNSYDSISFAYSHGIRPPFVDLGMSAYAHQTISRYV